MQWVQETSTEIVIFGNLMVTALVEIVSLLFTKKKRNNKMVTLIDLMILKLSKETIIFRYTILV